MKIFATVFFGGAGLFMAYCALGAAGVVPIPSDSPLAPKHIPFGLLGIMGSVICLWFIWVFTDADGNGPPCGTGMNLAEWRRELAERRCRQDFRTDEEVEAKTRLPGKLRRKVRVPGKQ